MKITKSQLKQIIKEELEKVTAEAVQAGGGLDNKELLAKFSAVQQRMQVIGTKEMEGKATPQEKEELEKLMNLHTLLLRKMFQGTAGFEGETGAVTEQFKKGKQNERLIT